MPLFSRSLAAATTFVMRWMIWALLLLPTIALAADLDDADLDRRIDQLHKGDLVVNLRDADGKPFWGDVRYEMTRQAFGFGTCVSADFIMHPTSRLKPIRRNRHEVFQLRRRRAPDEV